MVRARLWPSVELGLRESLSFLQMVSLVAEAVVGLSRLWTSLAPTVPIIRISVVSLQTVLKIE